MEHLWPPVLAILFVALNIADAVSTNAALANPLAREANPVDRLLMRLCGPLWVVPKLFVAGAAAALLWWLSGNGYYWPAAGALAALDAWMAWVVINNWRIVGKA